MKKNYIAFTMAEVLITLGILGIVIAMTLPALIGKYQEVVFKNKWKTLYSKISNAYLYARQELALEDNAEMFTSKEEMISILDVMKTSLNIRTSKYQTSCAEGETCIAGEGSIDTYHTMFGTGMNPYSFGGYGFEPSESDAVIWLSPDGATIYFRVNTFYDMFVIYVFVDVNGEKSAPNILGKDFLALVITPKGTCPIGADCGYKPQYFKDSCTSEKEIYASSQNGMHNGSPISGIGCSAELLLK